MNFTVIDIVFAIIVLVFAVMAWRRGFITEVLEKLAPVVSILVAALFFGQLAPVVVSVVSVPPVLSAVIAFVVLFVGTFIVIKILQVVLKGVVDSIDILKVDSILGLVLGVLEGLIVISAVMILLLVLPWESCHTLVYDSFAWSFLGGILATPTDRVQEFLRSTTDAAKGLV
ncbi:MAG: CvpA family protein [Treponema sp.]|nr:CvpA family protein [Treponema sp.]